MGTADGNDADGTIVDRLGMRGDGPRTMSPAPRPRPPPRVTEPDRLRPACCGRADCVSRSAGRLAETRRSSVPQSSPRRGSGRAPRCRKS
jgi:hypothetical protein